MFSFLNIEKLKKDDLKGIAKLMYQDVSDDSWDKENLTKRNLDFTIESIRYIDLYAKRLINTDFGTKLLNNHFDNFVVRIGAYMGGDITFECGFAIFERELPIQYSSYLRRRSD